ncbi:WW domain-containing oxidoreductase [Schistosoma japonicum]|nr:WW domain-containing oxidoreductase [Schistosoma japonicum]
MSTNLLDDSDSDDNLPAEWEQAIQDNFVVYYNRLTRFTQKTHPISGHVKQLPRVLPRSWSCCYDKSGKVVYVNSETGCSTYSDPRLTSAVLTHPTRSNGSSQFKFDKFSSVNDILLNKDLRGFYAVVTNSGCGLGLSIALHLVRYGAVVICACAKCPENAIPLFDDTMPFNENNVTNLQSLNWPLHACIITDDLLPPVAHWCFPQSFTRLVSCLGAMTSYTILYWLKSIFNNVKNCEIRVLNWIKKKVFSSWIPVSSCECLSKTFPRLTSDGFEMSIQCNYLAPALFLERLFKTRLVHTSHSLSISSSGNGLFSDSALRVVIVSSEIHKESDLQHFVRKLDFAKMLRTIPASLYDNMKRYADSKLCMLLFTCEYQQRLRQCSRTSTLPLTTPTMLICTGCDPFSIYCSKRFLINLYYLFVKYPFLLLLQTVYFLSRPFGMSSDQVTANPIFCAVHRVTYSQQSITGHHKQIPYFDKCRLSTSLLNDIPAYELDLLSKTIFTHTMNAFCTYD